MVSLDFWFVNSRFNLNQWFVNSGLLVIVCEVVFSLTFGLLIMGLCCCSILLILA